MIAVYTGFLFYRKPGAAANRARVFANQFFLIYNYINQKKGFCIEPEIKAKKTADFYL